MGHASRPNNNTGIRLLQRCFKSNQNQITLLATAPLIRSTGAQVQAYNYNANTIPINNKSKKT